MTALFIRRFTVNPDVFEQTVGDEVVIYNPDNGEAFGLDPVATAIWEIMQDMDNFSDILAALDEAFDVETDRLKADLEILGERLVALGFVRMDGEP